MGQKADVHGALTAVAWLAVGAGAVLLLIAPGVVLATIGARWGHEIGVRELAPPLWVLATAVLVLVGALVVAVIGRRWVALALALLLLLPAGAGAALLGAAVQHDARTTAPKPVGPPPCSCYSGGSCDCPGG